MSKRKFTKTIYAFFKSLFRQIWKLSRSASKKLANWLARRIIGRSRKRQLANAGFVLPTVAMVSIVVVLLSLTLLLRSFDRAENANTVRVNQQTLASVTPALDRARAKLENVLDTINATPSDIALFGELDKEKYTFKGEKRLKLSYDANDNRKIDDNESVNTAWLFEIDTDGKPDPKTGKYEDSIGLYSIYLRNPDRDPLTGEFKFSRSPIDVRTPPMPNKNQKAGEVCQAALGTSASLVGTADWYKLGAYLSRSFIIYAAIIPNSESRTFSGLELQQDWLRKPLTNNAVIYEDDLQITPGKGLKLNGGVFTNSNLLTAQKGGDVEYYQVSGTNSCFYEHQNSKIVIGGNIGIGAPDTPQDAPTDPVTIHLYQAGNAPNTATLGDDKTKPVDATAGKIAYNTLAFAERINNLVGKWIDSGNTNDPQEVADKVANAAEGEKETVRRKALENYFKARVRRVPFADNGANTADPVGSGDELRTSNQWLYPFDPNKQSSSYNSLNLNIIGSTMKPPASDPTVVETQKTEFEVGDRVILGNGLPPLWWKDDGTTTDFVGANEKQFVKAGQEVKWTGSNEPRYLTTQMTSLADLGDTDRDGFWEKAAAEKPQVLLSGTGGLRVVTGAGVYERINSFLPPPKYDDPTTATIEASDTYNDPATSGTEAFPIVWPDSMPMSPVVGSKVFDNSAATPQWIDWPTTIPGRENTPLNEHTSFKKFERGDLRMRATAAYIYNYSDYDPDKPTDYQKPLACISSYYDPTTPTSSRNMQTFAGRILPWNTDADGKSNNGIVYDAPSVTAANFGSATYNAATGQLTGSGTVGAVLAQQANLVFPDGRFANEPLRKALIARSKGLDLSLSQQSAIDSTICAVKILDGSLQVAAGTPVIPHGAIREDAFLDNRQIKAIEKDNPNTRVVETFTLSSPLPPDGQAAFQGKTTATDLEPKYDLPIEDRQPLEIRVTVLDLDQLRKKPYKKMVIKQDPGSTTEDEYLLPNSGIIYATRDDALPDRSNREKGDGGVLDEDKSRLVSPTDSLLDPTRRPHGIMLVNGSILSRRNETNEFKPVEKGLILATNLPTYIQAQNVTVGGKAVDGFNLHQTPNKGKLLEEFEQTLNSQTTWDFNYFYNSRKDLSKDFACRKNDPRLSYCNNGDLWRPASVIADSVTLLSSNFRPGFRTEGDYDLRNNAGAPVVGYDVNGDKQIKAADKIREADFGLDLNSDGDKTDELPETEITASTARLLNGFYDNNFVTSATSFISTATDTGYPIDFDTATNGHQASSYLNNFITPVQRRVNFPEYVMEMCPKLSVSACGPRDWVVGIQGGDVNAKATTALVNTPANNLLSGTTATAAPARPEYQRYPRRVAFLRDNDGFLLDSSGNKITATSQLPVPLGIDSNARVQQYPLNQSTLPRSRNALWFRTVSGSDPYTTTTSNWTYDAKRLFLANQVTGLGQPLLVPVLQLYSPTGSSNTATLNRNGQATEKNWLQPAINQNIIFNLILASGDVPSRTTIRGVTGGAETNGGYANFARFMENLDAKKVSLIGSTIQFRRSAYGTGPFMPIVQRTVPELSKFDYNTGASDPRPYKIFNNKGQLPQYSPPNREYGYDVGLLSQLPDLFMARFTQEAGNNDYYREINRNDPWIENLLCAKDAKTGTPAIPAAQRPNNCPN